MKTLRRADSSQDTIRPSYLPKQYIFHFVFWRNVSSVFSRVGFQTKMFIFSNHRIETEYCPNPRGYHGFVYFCNSQQRLNPEAWPKPADIFRPWTETYQMDFLSSRFSGFFRWIEWMQRKPQCFLYRENWRLIGISAIKKNNGCI